MPYEFYTLQNTATWQKQIKGNEFRNSGNNRRKRPWSGDDGGNENQISESLKK